MSIRAFYGMWPQYNERMVEVVSGLTPDDLALRPSDDGWPIWATVGHTAGGRAYWLCHVLGEPGIETTPFDGSGEGWEDDLDHPRQADELVDALVTTFAIVESCLEEWSPEMLGEEIVRRYGETRQVHTRSSILQRLLTHDAYHCGQLSELLGIHGLDQIDLWAARD